LVYVLVYKVWINANGILFVEKKKEQNVLCFFFFFVLRPSSFEKIRASARCGGGGGGVFYFSMPFSLHCYTSYATYESLYL